MKFIDDNITKNDLPIIISVVYQPKKGESELHSHALLAIGIEYNENDIPIKLLCLDPGASSPIYAKWNCFIDTSNNNSQYPYWYVTDRVCHKRLSFVQNSYYYSFGIIKIISPKTTL